MNFTRRPFAVLLGLLLLVCAAHAQQAKPSLTVTPDHPDYLYRQGEKVTYSILLEGKKGDGAASITYRLSEDGERTIDEGSLTLRGGKADYSGSLDRPGFLRLDLKLIAGTDTLKAACGCGVEVESIRPTNVLPGDYDRFWNHGRAELLRVAMDARLEPAQFDGAPGKHYLISLGNIDGARVMGKLIVPVGKGPFPAVLWVPYAGVYQVDHHGIYADSGFITLSVDAHGIAQDKPREWYRMLSEGPLNDYRTFGYDDPYQFYYRRTILGAIRAIDYLFSRDDVDTAAVAITGGSQGGALSLLVAGLDPRIKAVAAGVPAMCDHTGALHGRSSGWPQLIKHVDPAKVIPTTGYFDAALNAGMIQAPTLIGVGFIDPVCPPTTVYAAYNNLRGEKEIGNFTTLGHNEREGWVEYSITWLKKKMNVKE